MFTYSGYLVFDIKHGINVSIEFHKLTKLLLKEGGVTKTKNGHNLTLQ